MTPSRALSSASWRRWLPLLIGVVGVASTLALAANLRARERQRAHDAARAALVALTSEIDRQTEEQILDLARMARRWEQRRGTPRDDWEADARQMATADGHLQAIEWVDPGFHVRWIVPMEGNEEALGLDLGFEDRRRRALERSRDRRMIVVTEPLTLVQGGLGFLVFVPVFVDDAFDGFILGVYRVERLLDPIVDTIAPGYGIGIQAGEEPIFSREVPDPMREFSAYAPVRIRNLLLRASVFPGAAALTAQLTPLPILVVVAGLLATLVLGLVTHFGQRERRRAEELFAVNRSLRQEIDQREHAERELRTAHDELDRVARSIPVYLWSAELDASGEVTYLYYSPVVERITGRPPAFYLEGPDRWLSTIHPADRPRVETASREITLGGRDSVEEDYRVRLPDGSVRWVRDSVTARPIPGGRRLDGVVADITEQKLRDEESRKLEARVRQAQKLESLGLLAGGIAHDFNNLLVGVLGNVSLARDEVAPDHPLAPGLGAIEEAAKRASELCRLLLAYSGKSSFVIEEVDLRELILGMGALLQASLSKRVRLSYELPPSLPAVRADATQVRQVVMNLMTNAAEAIGDAAGTITIALRALRCDRADLEGLVSATRLDEGDFVRLTVSDTGSGMDSTTVERIFDPFDTTTEAGRGLGLAAVSGIVRGHQGGIRVESSPGGGSTISVLLPAIGRPAADLAAGAESPNEWRGDGEILLVDDEEVVRAVGRGMLVRMGFGVRTAASGREAVEILRASATDIRGAVLDLTMTGMDGRETLRELRRLQRELPVVISSGFTAHSLGDLTEDERTVFLQKPYTLAQLAAALRRVLDESGAPREEALR